MENRSDVLLKRGEGETIIRWARALPDEVIHQHLDLCMNCTWALALTGRPEEAEGYLRIAEAALEQHPHRRHEILTAQIHIARARHDWARTIELSQQALANIPPDLHEVRAVLNLNLGLALWQDSQTIPAEHAFAAAHESAKRERNHYIRLLALGMEAVTQVAQGRLRATFNRLRRTLDGDSDYPASAMIYIVLGALHYEWNDLAEAEAACDKAIALAQRGGNAEVLGSAYRLSAQISLARGDAVAARAAINAAIDAVGDERPAPHESP